MSVDTLFNEKVILKKLTDRNADFLYNLYSNPEVLNNFDGNPFLPNETPLQFTNRIISSCVLIWTIRSASNPDLVIGECALHHWDPPRGEIEIGGSLLPEYWGQGLMEAAFNILIEVAKENLNVTVLVGSTRTTNLKAIRMAEKMGFEKAIVDEKDTILKKVIAD